MKSVSTAPGVTQQPPLVIDAAHHDRLRQLAEHALDTAPDVAQHLLDEIDRAEVLPSADMPGNVVRIGSLVTYQDGTTGSIRTIRLVFPHEADVSAMRISVISPIGAALIGLSEGQTMHWQLRDGQDKVLTVNKVVNE